jgi:hydrogenase maturation protease
MMYSKDDTRDEHPGTMKIIGIGQSMRGDDAAGLAAVRLWQTQFQAKTGHPPIQVELAELPGIGLLDLVEGSTVAIIVDALHSGSKPGMIQVLTVDQLEAFTRGAGSAHGWGIVETLALGQKLIPSAMPQKIILLGIEAGDLSMGEGLSKDVELALPEAARMIEQLVKDS